LIFERPRPLSRQRRANHLYTLICEEPDKWQERPLALVVVHPGTDVDIDQLRSFLADKVAKWWIPERWSFVSDIPRTSVGKYDKKVIRARHSAGEYLIEIETS
ncbi:AMP-binding enzyme, partial [Mycobacteroides abscessus]|uniref:AMP-binding enzyme n=1 Tax=Mycobacteroides abscessus TaxID=36809 RepID=UPI000A59AC02